MLACCHCVLQETAESDLNYIPLVSPIIVIFLFIIDRIIGFNLRKKEIDRNWYFKVMIEPSIEFINNFYETIFSNYEHAAKILDSKKNGLHLDFVNEKSLQFSEFQVLKRNFESLVIQPILVRYSNVGNALTDALLELEDLYTVSLDKGIFDTEQINLLHQEFYTNRAKLFMHLYSPINIDK